jgi:hypothetical protein
MGKSVLIILLVFLVPKAFCQSEVKIYAGYYDYPGISFEYTFENKLSIELGGSFRTKLIEETWEDGYIDRRNSNLFINSFIKKYKKNKNGKSKFFYGAYIRFWQNHQSMEGLDNMTPQQQTAYDQGVTISSNENKISFGGLSGFKLPISNGVNIGFTFGLGFSPRKLYWEHRVSSDGTTYNDSFEYSETFGILFHLSGIGQISFSYVFKSKKN